jgi:DNA-binding GntR family transcriptional regulator
MANLTRERWDQAVREHDEILAALECRDAPRLQTLLREHLGNKMVSVLGAIEAAGEGATAATAKNSD